MGQALEQWIRRYAAFIIRYRIWVLITMLLLAVLAASGGRFLEFTTNYRIFFSSSNPELNAFEAFQKTYTKNDNILFVMQPKDGQVFTPQLSAAIEWLTEQSWKIPYTIRVDSISNFQHSWANGDQLTVEDLIRNGKDWSAAQLQQRELIALSEPLLRDNLISHDADTTGVNVTIQYPEINNIKEVPEAVAYARDLAKQLREQYPDLKVALTGLSMLNNAFAEAGQTDAMTLVPAMYGILLIMLLVALRSISATLVTVLVIGLSSASAMGLAGYFGIKLTPISVTAPTIIMTLAIADSIHILVTMLSLMREGTSKHDALIESLRINFTPVFITSLTTVVGFLSLNFSDAPPFWHLGNITAIGITAAWLFSITFLPALLSVLPVKVPKRHGLLDYVQRWLDRFSEFVIRRYRGVLMILGTLTVVIIGFVPNLSLNDQFVRYFDHRVEFRNDTDFTVQNLNGIYVIEYSVPAQTAGGISEPIYLEKLVQFTDWLRSQNEVMHVYSYSDIIKRLNKNMHADKTEYYRVPDQTDLAAQYLLLYELSLPYGLDLNDRINIDKSASRVSVTLQEISTAQIRDFLQRSKNWLHENAPEYMQAHPTSAAVMFAYISQRNIEGMLSGNAVAIIAIAIIMMLTLRSFSLGALSLIPNAVPILVTFGVWSILIGQVGMAAATVTATALGIIVDDSVHFLVKYLRARREKNLSAPDAIRYAFRMVGTAIVMTTLVLTIGFSVLAFSTFLINSQMGLLTAMTIVIGLVMDFLLLPALLLLLDQRKSKEEPRYVTAQSAQ